MGRNGKSRALICFVLCMIMALPVYFSSAVAVKAAEQQTIIIGTNAEYSPFEYLDDDGNITGFDYDLLEAIAKEENVKLVWKDMPFDSLMGSMEAGDVQVIAAGIGPTEDRKKSVDFSDVYYTGTQCIISRKDNPIKDFEEMSGKTVAVLEGAQSDMIASGETTDYGEVKDAKVTGLKNVQDIMNALSANQYDAAIVDLGVAKNYVKSGEFKMLDESLMDEQNYIIAKKGNTDMIEKMNTCIKKFLASEDYAKLCKKYGR